MARIVHIALKVEDLESATRFYEDVFGLRQTGTGHARGHVSRHMTDGTTDVALMVYDNEDVPEAQLSGRGPCIHHWGIEVDDREATAGSIQAHGGEIISKPGEGALKFRAPNGTVAEIVSAGRYRKKPQSGLARIAGLALKVGDLEGATHFYENVFGFEQVRTRRHRGHVSRHLTDGAFDLKLISYDSDEVDGAQLAGSGPRIHHWTVAAPDADAFVEAVVTGGGSLIAKGRGSRTVRAPDGTVAEIVSEKPRID